MFDAADDEAVHAFDLERNGFVRTHREQCVGTTCGDEPFLVGVSKLAGLRHREDAFEILTTRNAEVVRAQER
ncbi:MAG: hypothetical protein JRF55_06975, partial [Deltaproteobacteria bacterium]|nr:hypothetical protein [Deltaproteobacteria bacterium]